MSPAECYGCGAENHVICEACAAAEIIDFGERCAFCGRLSPGGRTCSKCRSNAPRHVWVTSDYDGLARELITKYKFGHLRVAAEDLAKLMSQTFRDFCAELSDYMVVPVPTATSRRRERGFDQAELLAQTIANNLNLGYSPALARLGQSRQLGSKRELRLKQAADSYYVRLPELVRGRNILLVDDVITTGATLRAATKTLRGAGARRIDGLVFAKRL